MFSDALGADDRGAVQRYLSRKWGLDASVAARSVVQHGTEQLTVLAKAGQLRVANA